MTANNYTMTINTRATTASAVQDFGIMADLAIGKDGTIYIGGTFADMSPGGKPIVEWDGNAWRGVDAPNYEPVTIADRCGFCGVNIQVVDICPRCGAPPVRKREYKRGKFAVTFYESLWAKTLRWFAGLGK